MGKRRDQFVYTLIGYILIGAILAGIGTAIAAGGLWAVNNGVSDGSLVKWGGLTLNTLGLFGWMIKQSRRFWRSRVFWWTITSLLFVHLAIFWLILINVERWRMAWFFVICTIEVIPISAALDWTFNHFGRGSRPHGVSGSRRK